jgi:hypothetical protein
VHPAAKKFARAVLVITGADAAHPRPIVMAAISIGVRLARTGHSAVVLCDRDMDAVLRRALGALTVHRAPVLETMDASVGPTDLVIVAGGRASGSATGRVERRAMQRGASVMVLSDADDVEPHGQAATVAAPLTAS